MNHSNNKAKSSNESEDMEKRAEEVLEAQGKAKAEVLPELSIGMIGHVDHGKTTLVKALSGKWTDTHSEEIKRGITIRLGYADISLYKCQNCKGPEAFSSQPKCAKCSAETEFIRKATLVDAPGHESLMATMLCGANIIDGALLLVAANEPCPQPQTSEHVVALQIMGMKNIIVVQNKIDLITQEQAKKNFKEIKDFLKNTIYKDAPIIPVSALHNINIDALLEAINSYFSTPTRDIDKPALMFIARSFDINKPGTVPGKIVGGVLGGVLRHGMMKVGDEIEILPGYEVEEKNMKVWKKLTTQVIGLMAGSEKVKKVQPGGTFAVLTSLDPNIVKSDQLVGEVAGHPGKLPRVWNEFILATHLLERIVGAKDKLVVEPIKLKEFLMLNVNSSATVGVVEELGKNTVKCKLRRPVCAEPGSRIAISRSIGQRWRLIGYGELKS